MVTPLFRQPFSGLISYSNFLVSFQVNIFILFSEVGFVCIDEIMSKMHLN